jgi:hypothetical protein
MEETVLRVFYPFHWKSKMENKKVVPELTPEEDIVIDELIERAKRWDVSDIGRVNTISRVVKNKEEERIVVKYNEWEQTQWALSMEESKLSIEGKQEEEAWEVALHVKQNRKYNHVNELLNKEETGEVVHPNEKGGFGADGVDRKEMLVELQRIAPEHPALIRKNLSGVIYRGY